MYLQKFINGTKRPNDQTVRTTDSGGRGVRRTSHLQVLQILQVFESAAGDALDLVVVEKPATESSENYKGGNVSERRHEKTFL